MLNRLCLPHYLDQVNNYGKFTSFSIVCFSQALSKMLANCTNTGNRLMQVGVEDVPAMRIDELCRLLQEHNVISEGRILEKFRSNAFFFSYMVLLLSYVIC